MSPRRFRTAGFVTLAAALLASPSPAGAAELNQPADERPPTAAGNTTDLFRGLLKFAGAEPLKTLDEAEDLSDVVLVLLGDISRERESARWCRRVMDRGGAVLIATARMTDFSPYFEPGVVPGLSGSPVQCTRPEACLGRVPRYPFLVNKIPSPLSNPDLERMAGLSLVANESPSSFQNRPRRGSRFDSKTIAELPEGCRLSFGVSWPVSSPTAAVLVTPLVTPRDPASSSIALVYSSPAMFANKLLMARGTDNFVYAYHMTNFLVTKPGGGSKRTKCFFVEDGTPVTNFDEFPLLPQRIPPVAPPVPALETLQDKLTDAVNGALDDVQTRDVLGRQVSRHFDRVMPVLAVVAAALATLFLVRRAWKARYSPEVSPPAGLTVPAGGSPLDRRRVEILRSNDLYEPLREHLRALFARWGRAGGGTELPPVEIAGDASEKRNLVGKISKLWEIAHGDTPVAVPYVRWKELEPMIESVTRAADAGRWRFAGQGGAA